MTALIIAIFPQNSSRGNWEEQQDRTDPNSRFELARKPAWLLAFRQFGLPKWKHDFECDLFDLLSNAPYVNLQKSFPEKGEKSRREQQILSCRKRVDFDDDSQRNQTQLPKCRLDFECSLLRPLE